MGKPHDPEADRVPIAARTVFPLVRLQKMISSKPKNTEITSLCINIISSPNRDYVPELFQLLHEVFNQLWVHLGKLEMDLDVLEDIQLPLKLEDVYLVPRVMCFNYLLLAIIVCSKDCPPLQFPTTLVKGLLALTKSKIVMTRLLSVGLLITNPQLEYNSLQKVTLPLVLDFIDRHGDLSSEILYPLIPIDISPIFMLKSLVDQNDSIIDTIIDNRYFQKINAAMISNFHGKDSKLPPMNLVNLSCSLSIISLACKRRKSCSEYITSPQLSELIQLTLERHIKMANTWTSRYIGGYEVEERASIYALSQRLTLASCDLLISLSRSGKILRTFIKDLDLAPVLYSILNIDTNSIPDQLKEAEIQLKIITMSVIANTIVEFSLETKTVGSSTDIINFTLDCLTHPVTNTQTLDMKEKCLWVLKNSLFSDNNTFKDHVLNELPYELLFQLSENDELAIKKQVFDIMRNIIAISNDNTDLLIFNFNSSGLQTKYGNFFTFIGTNLQTFEFLSQSSNRNYQLRESSQRVLQTVLYLLVHLSGCHREVKSRLLTETKILDTLHDILNRSLLGSSMEWDFKTAVALIITNLINPNDKSIDGMDDLQSDGDLKLRKRMLISKNFDSLLNNLCQSTNDIDFQEKARLAVFRLTIGSN